MSRKLPRKWIDRSGLITCPPPSPNCALADYFFLRYIKDAVNVPPSPTTLPELDDGMRVAAAVRSNMCTEAEYRYLCLAIHGYFTEHLQAIM